MTTGLYIAATEAATGKSLVALGLMDRLYRRVARIGVFRPVVRDGASDNIVELLRSRYQLDPAQLAIGVSYDELHADPERATGTIVERYRSLARTCDAVLVVGTDYTGVGAATELEFNGRLAANLGTPVVLVLSGAGRRPDEVGSAIQVARAELAAEHAGVLAVVVNRVDELGLQAMRQAVDGLDLPAYAIPEIARLAAPTVEDLAAACGGRLVSGDESLIGREAPDLLVAAMTLPNLLDHLADGAVVITAGDRADVLLGLLLAHRAEGFPALAAIVLSGGLEPPEPIQRLLAGLDSRLPVFVTAGDTYATATQLAAVRGRITPGAEAKAASALGAFEEYVDGGGLLERLELAKSEVVTPLMFEYELVERARQSRQHIVLPEGGEERILRAADILLRRGVADLTLLGDEHEIRARAAELRLSLEEADVLSPHDPGLRDRFAEAYAAARAHKGMTFELARDVVTDVSYFGTMLVHLGMADGMVSGSIHTTAHTIRPAFEVIKTAPGVSIVSSVFFMCLADRVLAYGDCAVNPDPTAEQLADIALSSALTAGQFGVEPRVAMLSYSTGESGFGQDVDKVREATRLVRERRPELAVDGPIQYDAAVEPSVARTKLPDSPVAGRATVLVFPDLNTGNNTYKAVQRSAGAVAVGPVLQGLRKPINDLSRGATVQDIVNTVAITAIQAQQLGRE
ncbi:phosphate acetyltransferase [Flindersiella endophytica]